MASPDVLLYVFVPNRRGQEICFPHLSVPGSTVRSLCKAVQKKSRSAGGLSLQERISCLKLVFENEQADAVLVGDEPLQTICTALSDISGANWRMLGSGVRPRIVAVVKKKRGVAAAVGDEGGNHVNYTTPERSEGERQSKRQHNDAADQQGPLKAQKRGPDDSVRGRGQADAAPGASCKVNDEGGSTGPCRTQARGSEARQRHVDTVEQAGGVQAQGAKEGGSGQQARDHRRGAEMKEARCDGGKGEGQGHAGRTKRKESVRGISVKHEIIDLDDGTPPWPCPGSEFHGESEPRAGGLDGGSRRNTKVERGEGESKPGNTLSRKLKTFKSGNAEDFQQLAEGSTGQRCQLSSDENAVSCDTCGETESSDLMLMCAGGGCGTSRHVYCHSEELLEVPEGNWFCSECQGGAGREAGIQGVRRAGTRGWEEATTGEGQGGGESGSGPWVIEGQPKCKKKGCTKNAHWGHRRQGRVVKER